MSESEVRIDRVSFNFPGLKELDGQRIADSVIQKLKINCPEINCTKNIDCLDIDIKIPAGTPDYMYADIIAAQVIKKLI